MAGIVLIILALAIVWYLDTHPDLGLGMGFLLFGASWLSGLVGIYVTLKTYWT